MWQCGINGQKFKVIMAVHTWPCTRKQRPDTLNVGMWQCGNVGNGVEWGWQWECVSVGSTVRTWEVLWECECGVKLHVVLRYPCESVCIADGGSEGRGALCKCVNVRIAHGSLSI